MIGSDWYQGDPWQAALDVDRLCEHALKLQSLLWFDVVLDHVGARLVGAALSLPVRALQK